ncbi:hypothetical protein PF005_g15998 [Phytophthora fragariae]|uniref:Uncharacterized protein n=1 Tax=Phytophthora fragariae TaxID=53985 RepID=A0A6A3XAK8_9STRA|nr:hypothetical protein PF005_g15998 [Phytophthora fragariae]
MLLQRHFRKAWLTAEVTFLAPAACELPAASATRAVTSSCLVEKGDDLFDVQSLAEIVRPEQACLLGPGTIEKKVKIGLPSRQCRRLAVRAEEGAGPEPTAVAFDVEEVARIIVNNV